MLIEVSVGSNIKKILTETLALELNLVLKYNKDALSVKLSFPRSIIRVCVRALCPRVSVKS